MSTAESVPNQPTFQTVDQCTSAGVTEHFFRMIDLFRIKPKGKNKGKGIERKKRFSKKRGRTWRLVTLPSQDGPNAQRSQNNFVHPTPRYTYGSDLGPVTMTGRVQVHLFCSLYTHAPRPEHPSEPVGAQ